MKKMFKIALTICILNLIFISSSFADGPKGSLKIYNINEDNRLEIYINNQYFYGNSFTEYDIVYIKLSKVAEKLGIDLEWEHETKCISYTINGKKTRFLVEHESIYQESKNGEKIEELELGYHTSIKDGHVYLIPEDIAKLMDLSYEAEKDYDQKGVRKKEREAYKKIVKYYPDLEVENPYYSHYGQPNDYDKVVVKSTEYYPGQDIFIFHAYIKDPEGNNLKTLYWFEVNLKNDTLITRATRFK